MTSADVVSIRRRAGYLLAQFDGPRQLLEACVRVRTAGFEKLDAHTPFPVHGLEQALGLGNSPLGWIVFVAAMVGAAGGMLLESWVSVVAAPLSIAGKPLFSWPAFVPIAFELGVLGGALGAIFGFLSLAHLPRFHHPLFSCQLFEQVTDDGFFLSLEAVDPAFDLEAATRLLIDAGASRIEVIER